MTISDNQVRRYLLDLLSEEEAREFDAALMAEGELRIEELISTAEEDLISDYLHDRLTSAECAKFESHFLATPDRVDHLRERKAIDAGIRALEKDAARRSQERKPFLRRWLEGLGPGSGGMEAVPAMGALKAGEVAIGGTIVDVGRPDEDSAVFQSAESEAIKVGDMFDVFPAGSDRTATSTQTPIASITVTSIRKGGKVTGKYRGARPAKKDIVRLRPVAGQGRP